MTIRRRDLLGMLTTTTLAASSAALAGVYPQRPVRIVVGFPPGGPLDIVARTIAAPLSRRFGTAFEIDNRPGASGNRATAAVVEAAPDGHTLLLCGPVNTINTSLFAGLGFDFARDTAPVAMIARVPLIVEVNRGLPVASVPELLALARRSPSRLRVAFAGAGTPQHIAIALFQAMAGVTVTLLPHAGSASALAALQRGEADAMFDPAPSSLPLVRAGQLVPLATTGERRAAALPDVPTLAEFLPGYAAGSWFGLAAPRGIPAAVRNALNTAVNEALADPNTIGIFQGLGATVEPGSPAQFGRFIAAETARYRDLIAQLAIKP